MTERSDDASMGDEVYQPGDPDAREDQGILDAEDTLYDRGVDPYDEGYSPPERPLAVEHTGVTAAERRAGETLDERLSEEQPDTVLDELEALESDDGGDEDGGDLRDGDGEPLDDEVGTWRAGRLAPTGRAGEPDAVVGAEPVDEVAHHAAEEDMLAEDVGLDGGAASAEEAAMFVVEESGGDGVGVG
ncbi:hypothetical protein GTW43_09265 [Streptomyces sp. SID5785]|uniref:DUF5709 domain-containing protein n=1 Tax=Streptomyces sp. SID5785 TaxID=2690309 RepID=UPI00136137FF|nr:DUF5709 domain-containing protein [Streptomyces sp. SID5785]MZD05268.1 hypothetical protein [Streptomyces sp. SID5785]